jgi:hypothetical protein
MPPRQSWLPGKPARPCPGRLAPGDPRTAAPVSEPAYTLADMDWKIELVAASVTDLDRAMAFYVDQVGFHPAKHHRQTGRTNL